MTVVRLNDFRKTCQGDTVITDERVLKGQILFGNDFLLITDQTIGVILARLNEGQLLYDQDETPWRPEGITALKCADGYFVVFDLTHEDEPAHYAAVPMTVTVEIMEYLREKEIEA